MAKPAITVDVLNQMFEGKKIRITHRGVHSEDREAVCDLVVQRGQVFWFALSGGGNYRVFLTELGDGYVEGPPGPQSTGRRRIQIIESS